MLPLSLGREQSLQHEIGDEYIGFTPDLAEAVRGEHQLASVMGEHGKAVEAFIDTLKQKATIEDDEA